MDPLTHALSGALLAFAATPSRRRRPADVPRRLWVLAGFVAALFPDLDFALRLVDTMTYLNLHQGVTHSLVMLPLWALLLALVFAAVSGWRYSWWQFLPPVFLGLAIHIAGDFITPFGLMLFAPFSDQRYSVPLIFLFDPWLTLIIVAGLALTFWKPERRAIPVVAMIAVGGYVAFLGAQHYNALDATRSYMATRAIEEADAHVLPQPLSPFNWKLIVEDPEGYHIAHVNLRRTTPPAVARVPSVVGDLWRAYQPIEAADWDYVRRFGAPEEGIPAAEDVWLEPALTGFREFATLPLLHDITRDGGHLCLWFIDLRFVVPGLPPWFRYGACQTNGDSQWDMEKARGRFWID